MAAASVRAPIADGRPVAVVNRAHASTLGELVEVDVVDGVGVGGAEVAHDGPYVGQQKETVGGQVEGDAGGGVVLVDHRLDAAQVTILVSRDGCATAAGTDDDRAGLEQALDGVLFEDA